MEGTNGKYIADIITISEIEKWNPGDTILINAPTGKGKSYFTYNNLAEYCREHKKSMMLLGNRTLLKEQNIKLAKKYSDVITIVNYQKLEKYIQRHKGNVNFDFVIADECHYFFNDSPFNDCTDLSFAWLLHRKGIKILMSATMNIVEKYLTDIYQLEGMIKYNIDPNYDYIDKFYFYNNDSIIEKLLYKIPKDEKIIYFAGTKKVYKIKKKFENTAFICSESSKHSKYSNKDVKIQIINDERFDCQILCTTSVLDNGVNIKDESVKHIIIDYFDLDTVQQCFGRKRIMDDEDRVNIYIKNRKSNSLNATKQQLIWKMKPAQYLKNYGQHAYINKYGKENVDTIVYDALDKERNNVKRINAMKWFKCNYDIEFIDHMLEKEDIYIEEVLNRFRWQSKEWKTLDKEFDKSTLETMLDKYVGVKMFEDEQSKFKDYLLNELFNSPKKNHGSLGLKTINALLDDNRLNYVVKSERENSRKSDNYKKTYWIVGKVNY